jgi:hypothetical protein
VSGSGTGNVIVTGKFYGTATSAQYADLAESYLADAPYSVGTVLEFGGVCEVTESKLDASTRIAGVVSDSPGYLMNSHLVGDYIAVVALQGRVPVKVTGSVRKGDMLVSAGNGYARVSTDPKVGSVIGKSLENFDGESGIVEVVVGRD